MPWYHRPTTAHERTEFSRLKVLDQLTRHWHEALASLPFQKLPAFDSETLDDALAAEQSHELLHELRLALRHRLDSWVEALPQLQKSQGPIVGRLLRMTEEEAVRYTSAQWNIRSPSEKGARRSHAALDLFPDVSSVFAAYRETPFFTLFRDSLLRVTQRSHRVEMQIHHGSLLLESAWMRGFLAVLRPQTRMEVIAEGRLPSIRWTDLGPGPEGSVGPR